MPLIVNLSAIHTLHPTSRSIDAFEQVCNKYSTGYFSSCPSLFQSWSNYAWLMFQHSMNDKRLIQPYRLGTITTEQFLKNLLTIFSFLKNVKPKSEDSIRINSKNLYSQDFALAILEEAWNEIIGLDDTRASRFPLLTAQSEPVYLISNTNELNVLKILQLLKANNPDVKFFSPIDLSVKEDKAPIEIAPNIFLCLSYRYQLFKTMKENQTINPHSTMSLLNYLINQQLLKISGISTIRVVSQYPDDLREAHRIGVHESHTYGADEFFSENNLEIKKLL